MRGNREGRLWGTVSALLFLPQQPVLSWKPADPCPRVRTGLMVQFKRPLKKCGELAPDVRL